MIGDGVSLGVDAAHQLRIGLGHAPDHEKRRLHAFRRQNVEHPAAMGRERAVVEGEHDFLVVERQRFAILHAAQMRGDMYRTIAARLDRRVVELSGQEH